MVKSLKAFAANKSGAAMVEYGIILLVAVTVGFAAFITLGENIETNITNLSNGIAGVEQPES